MASFGFLVATSVVFAAQGPRVQKVSFKPGASSTVLTGTIKGDETVDYELGARARQTMKVSFKSASTSASFNVLPPGSEAAIAIGDLVGNEWSGTLPTDGNYRVRVFLVRAAARRNASATYSLTVGINGSADALVAGTNFHATGMTPCSVGPDPKGSAQCSFGVIRAAAGKAEVYLAAPGFDVKLHKDQVRVLRFAGDAVTSADAKEKVTAAKQGDNWMVSVNDFYFYTIPEAVILAADLVARMPLRDSSR